MNFLKKSLSADIGVFAISTAAIGAAAFKTAAADQSSPHRFWIL